jgi:hypothetical protein
LKQDGALVYRLGHGPLKAERRVQFPCALPFAFSNLPSSIRSPVQLVPLSKLLYPAEIPQKCC